MTELRVVSLSYSPRFIIIEHGNYVITGLDSNKIHWYDRNFNEKRVVTLGYGAYGITIEYGNYVLPDYDNQKIHWYDRNF